MHGAPFSGVDAYHRPARSLPGDCYEIWGLPYSIVNFISFFNNTQRTKRSRFFSEPIQTEGSRFFPSHSLLKFQSCHIGRTRALHSLAAFEPYSHRPHSSLTVIGSIQALHLWAAFDPCIHWPHSSHTFILAIHKLHGGHI